MFTSAKKRNKAAATAAQARHEAALRAAGFGVSSKEHERNMSASTTTSRNTGFVSPPLPSPIFGIPPPPRTSSASKEWDRHLHERNESNSTSTTATFDRSRSPRLGLTFDFEFPPSPALSSDNTFGTDALFRPSTSDGSNLGSSEETGRKSSVTAPVLPQIPRVSDRNEEPGPAKLKATSAVFDSFSRRAEEEVDRETERRQPPAVPPPPLPVVQTTRTAERHISSQSYPPPQPSQRPREKESEKIFVPSSQPTARQPSLTPPQEKHTEYFKAQASAQPRKPPPQVTAQKQVPIPPPPIPPEELEQSDNFSTTSQKSKRSRIKSFFFDKPNPDFLSQSRPSSAGGDTRKMSSSSLQARPSTSSGGGAPKMEPSLFPSKEAPAPALPRQESLPVMNRAWLDARDKPYQNATSKAGQTRGPYLQHTHSTPDLLSASAASPSTSHSARSLHTPLNTSTNRSPLSTSASADPSPQSPRLTFVRPANSFGKSSLSAESEVSSPAPTLPTPTVGTPYQETSPQFPLPQYVATRPKTAGAGTSSIGGVQVPTHYTSSKNLPRPETSSGGKSEKAENADKKERRKTRLLNPLNLLARRRSGQDEEVVQNERAVQVAQAQALQKQKSVAIAGVNKIPENYDPRIRGKVVHDFSAPRGSRRTGSYSDGGPEPAWNAVARGLQAAQSAPYIPTLQDDGRQSQTSGSGKHLSVSTMATSATSSSGAADRRSRYVSGMGVFHEHLSETPDRGSRISSLQAEKRENKDFLQRASHLSQQSQESAILPPFARRSHPVDPMQVSQFNESDDPNAQVPLINRARKENRDSSVSSISGVSPITARTSSAVALSDAHISFSPVSPTSPAAPKPPGDGRSPSAISPPASESRPTSSYFNPGLGSKSSRGAASPLDGSAKSVSPAPSPNEVVKEAVTPKKSKKSLFSIKIPSPFHAPEVPLRGPSAASGYAGSPISSPTARSIKSAKSTKSARSVKSMKSAKSGRSQAGTPSLHSLPSNVPTPEPHIAEPAIFVSSPKSPRFVQKLATAVGHSKRNGNKKEKLEHQASNASRFSFQFGGSAAEELALEEKARKMRANGEPVSNPLGDEDEEDFFDEDAMDDMDEMEMQAEGQSSVAGPDGIVVNHVGGKSLTLLEQVQVLQAQQAQQEIQSQAASIVGANGGSSRSSVSQFMYRTPAATAKAKLQLQLDIQENDSGQSESESESDRDDDEEDGYWALDDFMGYSANHTREPSVAEPVATIATASSPRNGVASSPSLVVGGGSSNASPKQQIQRQRGASAASARGLTLNTNVGPSSVVAPPLEQPPSNVQAAAAFVQDTLAQQARSGFYMQPAAAGYSPPAANAKRSDNQTEGPAVPHRDSGNSEHNRAASGLAFSSGGDSTAGHKAALSSSTIGSLMSVREDGRPFSQSTVGGSSSCEPRTTSTGLGLSGFSDLKFTDSAPPSRPLSLEQTQQIQDRGSRDSETIPRTFNWMESNKGSPGMRQHGRNSSEWTAEMNGTPHKGAAVSNVEPGTTTTTARQNSLKMADDDDVYFDDGRFDLDIEEAHNVRGSVNESAFDDDRFDFDKINGVGQAVQPPSPGAAGSGYRRDTTGLTITSLASDGPYPSFAMPNAAKARQRDSTYLLEDLPLQEQAVDPRYIPRRNPSEDAKRLGLSDKVPPLPPQPGSLEAVQRVSASLQAYHAALADAANKAAAEGRFSRMPSVSSAKSVSAYSNGEASGEEKSHLVSRDASHYSRNEDGELQARANGVTDLDRNESVETSHSKMGHSTDYSPPKPDFDFGFDSIPSDDVLMDDFNDLDDDDIVAEANAEALASDDEGFYGQEFGFYAKARPNSGDLQAVMGGYFGEDGDDGLTRNKSTKEPNLTPITERSEFSTRNSFIGMGSFGPASAGPMSAGSFSSISPAVARLPFSPLEGGEVTSFDQLRKLRAHAFGGSNGSLHSNGRNSNSSLPLEMASDSPTWSTRSSAAAQGYFGPLGGAPMTLGYSTDSSGSSNPPSAHPQQQLGVNPVFQDSPHSAASSGHLPFSTSTDNEATPKRPIRESIEAPLKARKVPGPSNIGVSKGPGHSRKSSKDSVTYIQEQDPAGNGQPRWVIERRRTSEQGQLELVAREVVQNGWI